MDWNNFGQVEANKFLKVIDQALIDEITEQMCEFLWIELFIESWVDGVEKIKRTFEDVYSLVYKSWFLMNHEVYTDDSHKQVLEVQFYKLIQKRKVNVKTKFSFDIVKQWQVTETFE